MTNFCNNDQISADKEGSTCTEMLEAPISPSSTAAPAPLMAHEVLQRLRAHRATRQKLREDVKPPSDAQLLAAAFRGCDLLYCASASPPGVLPSSPSDCF